MTYQFTGIKKENAEKLGEKLNQLLANYSVFYMNVRGFHWNIKGDNFFELHLKFEELYNDLQLKIDEIAERIVTLGQVPLHSYSDYAEISQIKSYKNISDGKKSVSLILESFEKILKLERETFEIADNFGDEATLDQIGSYLREQEKLVWMYAAYLG